MTEATIDATGHGLGRLFRFRDEVLARKEALSGIGERLLFQLRSAQLRMLKGGENLLMLSDPLTKSTMADLIMETSEKVRGRSLRPQEDLDEQNRIVAQEWPEMWGGKSASVADESANEECEQESLGGAKGPLLAFGMLLGNLRERKNLSKEDVAEKAGIEVTTLLAIELGWASLDDIADNIDAIGIALDIDPVRLSQNLLELLLDC